VKIPSPKLNNPLGNLLAALKPFKKKVIFHVALLLIMLIVTTVLIFSQTIAWQTNVVHTGGLMFSADTWNFSAKVELAGVDTPASPGDSGVIEIQMTNDSADLAAASVKISKDAIIDQMKKRVYFYVDTSAVRHGETVDRVYINGRNSYTYTIFPHNELMLGFKSGAQPVIKWEWTYDNLGHYVYGRKTETGNVQIEEFLRPIEYDFDFMKTTFKSNGRLETVDGEITAEEFLKTFSQTDGYEGQIDTSAVTSEGYYPVDINNETGYGVFAYLCTLDEINAGSVLDTQLGGNSQPIGEATVQITGQNCSSDGVLVFDEQSLNEALSTPGLNLVTLNEDITLSEAISINESSQAVIDLAGHKITSTAATVVEAKDGASVMLSNGEICGNEGIGVSSIASSVTLNNVTITNVDDGVVISDNKSSSGIDSVVHLKGCEINAAEDGLWIYGNGAVSEQKTSIVVENCNIIGQNYAGVICNGAQYGTDIQITNSSVKGKYAAIYFPQKDSTLTVTSSTLEGYTGVAVKGGTVNIVDCTVTGTGEYTPLPSDPSELSKSGWWDTGDGVYLEANYTEWQTNVFISGDKTKITGTQEGTLAVRQYPEGVSQAKIEISGGSFSSDVSAYLKESYSINSSSDGYTVVKE